MEQKLLKEIDNLENISNIPTLADSLGKEFNEMINGILGNEILNTGHSMTCYLLDLFKFNIQKGMEAINIFYVGYPNIKYTDIFSPYYDTLTTRRLWLQASKKLDMKNHMHSSLVMNTYFRWYSSTFELFRKMLIYDCYCLGIKTGHEINIKNYLFGIKDPSKKLKNEGPSNRLNLLNCYDSTIRHSISHGNIMIIPGYGIVIRESKNGKEEINEKKYTDPDDFISSVTPNIEVMCGAVRLFYFIITAYLVPKFIDLFNRYLSASFSDATLVAMVRSIQRDSVNVVY